MANSTEVDHTMAVLASQYNNLRDDILDATTGHNHSGSVDGGRQLAGSVALTAHSVTQGKVALGGLFLVKRQGGHSSNWGSAGVSDYSITDETLVQAGLVEVTIPATYLSGTKTIAFGTTFSGTPLLYATAFDSTVHPSTDGVAGVSIKATTGSASTHADIYGQRPPSASTTGIGTVFVNWLAIGPST